jgi:hypothetical protein
MKLAICKLCPLSCCEARINCKTGFPMRGRPYYACRATGINCSRMEKGECQKIRKQAGLLMEAIHADIARK